MWKLIFILVPHMWMPLWNKIMGFDFEEKCEIFFGKIKIKI